MLLLCQKLFHFKAVFIFISYLIFPSVAVRSALNCKCCFSWAFGLFFLLLEGGSPSYLWNPHLPSHRYAWSVRYIYCHSNFLYSSNTMKCKTIQFHGRCDFNHCVWADSFLCSLSFYTTVLSMVSNCFSDISVCFCACHLPYFQLFFIINIHLGWQMPF